MTNVEREQNKTGHELQAKNDGGFRHKPRGDWFSFVKVRNGLHVRHSEKVRKKSVIDIYLTKHGFATGGLYSPPEPCEACFITDARTLFHVFWTKSTHLPHCKAWRGQESF